MAKYKKNRGNGNEDNEFVAPKGVKVFEEITNLETRIEAETPEKGFSPPTPSSCIVQLFTYFIVSLTSIFDCRTVSCNCCISY